MLWVSVEVAVFGLGVKARHYHLSGEIMWNWWQSKAECCGCWLLRFELNGGLLGRLLGSRSRFGAARRPKWVNPCRCWRACSTCMMGRRSIEMLRLATFSWPHRFDLRQASEKNLCMNQHGTQTIDTSKKDNFRCLHFQVPLWAFSWACKLGGQ